MTSLDDPKAAALSQLDAVRRAVDADDIETASEQLQRLSRTLAEWRKDERVRKAREWLDEALQADLLVFNGEAAQKHLTRWREAAADDTSEPPELAVYQSRVDERIKQKREALHVRGVMAHCNDLLDSAKSLESGDNPPNPRFMLENYYDKARDIAAAALADIPNSPELEVLGRKTGRVRMDKVMAARIYPAALEDHKYTDALTDLDKLPHEMLVPRFVLGTDEDGEPLASFEGMVSKDTARTEIREQARGWAAVVAQQMIREASAALNDRDPDGAIEAMARREALSSLLDAEVQAHLQDLHTRATNEQANRAQAEALGKQALSALADDDLAAWNLYAQASNLYRGAPGLSDVREQIVSAMGAVLGRLVNQAQAAFDARDMAQVRSLQQRGQSSYTNKDDRLNDALARLSELEGMSRQYDDYLQSANGLHQQAKDLLWEDPAGANDILTQLESYPDIVLENFDDLYELRSQVNQRINAENTYRELYPLLFNTDRSAVQQGIQAVKAAAGEHRSDRRFEGLQAALELHLTFVTAQAQLAQGQADAAISGLRQVAAAEGHPDQGAAAKLLSQQGQQGPPPENT